ncbi:glycogen-binding domain-containing protein [Treponema sp. OMZ 855]|uniref:glycogen-binding domain-containing protein n=1 Tax=Treponema sp. OMZ 855 TaxID=1643512 RepID=UPI0020A2F263|nr:glycogen-binding domain-containing protein [Treponema sp. OMZ 855]UTC51375.1 isoamylase [Treponema sp. OMZ 855]
MRNAIRQKAVAVFFFLCILIAAQAAEQTVIDTYTYGELVETIARTDAPLITGKYIIFTAAGSARHVGIAFEHENFQSIHSFQRLYRSDDSTETKKSILFYIMQIPEEMRELHYRLVINGLWSTDPLNPDEIFDYSAGMSLSVLKIPYQKEYRTAVENNGRTRFVYQGESGKRIYLAGTFNNWDPFMYTLEEVMPGRYELYLPLPNGVWYYAYFKDGKQIPDTTNREHVYMADGRTASVISVK